MKRIIASLCLSMIAGPALAGPADQFDLVCSTTLTVGNQSPMPTGEIRYSFDLDRQEWCPTTNCSSVGAKKLVEITSTTILVKSDSTHNWSISRTDGTMNMASLIGGDTYSVLSGSCQKAPFTPFPAAKF